MEDNHEPVSPLTETERNEMWEKVLTSIRMQERKKRKNKLRIFTGFAALIIMVGIVGNLLLAPTVYQAKTQNLSITLKDNTQVTLFKGAILKVESNLWTTNRNVVLEGNALFKVAKSKEHPFIVHGKNYETKVLGTIFKVVQRGNNFHIDLFEGKVQVYRTGTKQAFTLQPKETFSNMGSFKVATIKSSIGNNEHTKISTATISVNNIPLFEAVHVIENTYGIKIKYPDDKRNSVISVFKENANGNELLQLISIQLNLKVKTINDQTFELED